MPDLWKRIDELAAVLGVARDVIWSALIRQQILNGISMIVMGILVIWISAWGINILIRGRAASKDPDERSGFAIGAVILTGVVLGFASFVLAGAWRLLNPEYFAVQKLLEVLR